MFRKEAMKADELIKLAYDKIVIVRQALYPVTKTTFKWMDSNLEDAQDLLKEALETLKEMRE